MDETRLKELLLTENADFRRLHQEHQGLEKKLAELAGKPFLTADEETEVRELKKKKLALKDRMYLLMQDRRRTL